MSGCGGGGIITRWERDEVPHFLNGLINAYTPCTFLVRYEDLPNLDEVWMDPPV